MNGGMRGGMPPFGADPYKNKPKPPKGLRDIPRFLVELIGGFFSRLAYIVNMVWKTGPWILIAMVAVALLTGILPVVGSLISKEILNELQQIISESAVAQAAGVSYEATFWGSAVMLLLIFFFVHKILNNVVGRINTAVTDVVVGVLDGTVNAKTEACAFSYLYFHHLSSSISKTFAIIPSAISLSSSVDTFLPFISSKLMGSPKYT